LTINISFGQEVEQVSHTAILKASKQNPRIARFFFGNLQSRSVSNNLKHHQLIVRILTYISIFLFSVSIYGQALSTPHYKSFNDFYGKIADKKKLKFTNLPLTDTLTQTKRIGKDLIQKTFSLKFSDCDLKFVTTKKFGDRYPYPGASYIFYNNQKILPDTNIGFERLAIKSATKIVLNGTSFLVLSCWAPDCTGTFCRAEYDQLFQIKGKEIKHQVICGWQLPKNIYCDLNNDRKLDLIYFVGNCFFKNGSIKTNDSDKYFFCIQAKTLENNSWVALTDKYKKPYYIYFQVDDFFELDTFKVIDYNWMTEL
jgi:hypothetical protein